MLNWRPGRVFPELVCSPLAGLVGGQDYGSALTTLVRVGPQQAHNDLTWSNRYCP
jgi:hypothetical protein